MVFVLVKYCCLLKVLNLGFVFIWLKISICRDERGVKDRLVLIRDFFIYFIVESERLKE